MRRNKNDELITAMPVINLHLKASFDAAVGSQALYGWPVRRLARQIGWLRVRTEDGYEGWIREEGVQDARSSPPAVVHVRSLSANVYQEPDVTKHSPLLCLPWEARLIVHPLQEASAGEEALEACWLHVLLLDGSAGYVLRGDVRTLVPGLTTPELLTLAHEFKGVTYTWGGRSSFGFDCSGYTQMLMRQRGVLMPRDAHVQAAWEGLLPVDDEPAKPGDLLFFHDGDAIVTHTGLALGDGLFIHSSMQGQPGVQVSGLDETHWKTRLVAQRRAR